MGTGGVVAVATPGGVAADLTILAASLSSLAGLLFLVYVGAFLTAVAYGIVRGPSRRGAVAPSGDADVALGSTGKRR